MRVEAGVDDGPRRGWGGSAGTGCTLDVQGLMPWHFTRLVGKSALCTRLVSLRTIRACGHVPRASPLVLLSPSQFAQYIQARGFNESRHVTSSPLRLAIRMSGCRTRTCTGLPPASRPASPHCCAICSQRVPPCSSDTWMTADKVSALLYPHPPADEMAVASR